MSDEREKLIEKAKDFQSSYVTVHHNPVLVNIERERMADFALSVLAERENEAEVKLRDSMISEYRSIKHLLSRRPIFDDCETVYDQVSFMLSVCGAADSMLRKFERRESARYPNPTKDER